MKRRDIHLYLSGELYSLIKQKAAKYGLTPGVYLKYIVLHDVQTPMKEVKRTGLLSSTTFDNEDCDDESDIDNSDIVA